jgi:BRCA1-associated protein
LPKCPLCIEKLDSTLSGINLEKIKSLFIYDVKERWDKLRSQCKVCQKIQLNNNKCSCCESEKDLWICLICSNVGCGRYKLAHAKDHFEE